MVEKNSQHGLCILGFTCQAMFTTPFSVPLRSSGSLGEIKKKRKQRSTFTLFFCEHIGLFFLLRCVMQTQVSWVRIQVHYEQTLSSWRGGLTFHLTFSLICLGRYVLLHRLDCCFCLIKHLNFPRVRFFCEKSWTFSLDPSICSTRSSSSLSNVERANSKNIFIDLFHVNLICHNWIDMKPLTRRRVSFKDKQSKFAEIFMSRLSMVHTGASNSHLLKRTSPSK